MKIYSLIPARGGSKGVPKKNIKLLGGFPLIAYSIVASLLCKSIQRTIVSTDSEEIAEIARKYGAEVPFMRPARFAGDKSGDLEVFQHALKWLERNEKSIPDLFIHLRPTTPLRSPDVIEAGIRKIKKYTQATSLRSACALPEPAQKMLKIGKRGYFEGFFPSDSRPEYYNLPRQFFPTAFRPNGYVDIVKTKIAKRGQTLYGAKMFSFITDDIGEIDTLGDFEYLTYLLTKTDNLIYKYLCKNFLKEQ